MEKRISLLEGPPGKTLIRMTIPAAFGIVAIMLFNIVDTFFVSRLGTQELAAIGFTYPVVFIVMSLAIGIGMGATSAISRAIGNQHSHQIKRLTTDSLFLAFVLFGVVAAVGLFTISPVFRLMGASETLISRISEYMTIWYLGIGLIVVPMVGNSAIRSTGDTKTPAVIMAIAAAVNVVLDPLLIFGVGIFPRMELRGAALATVISYGITMVASLWILGRRERMLSAEFPRLNVMLDSWKQILSVGVPAAATQMVVPLSTGMLMRMISEFGEPAVGAYGVGIRIESLALIGVIGFGFALMPFVGQNFGAAKKDRTLEAIRFAGRYAIVWGLGAAMLLALFATPIAGIFSDDARVIPIIASFLWIVPVSYGLYGVSLLTSVSFNAINRPLLGACRE